MPPVTGAIAATTTTAATPSATAKTPTTTEKTGTSGTTSFADELKKSTPTTKAPAARPAGEKTAKVHGHPYARITSGDDKGSYLNQLAGSPRKGSVFSLVQRDGHSYHVYGTGTDRYVAQVQTKDQPSPKTTGGTAS